MHILEVIPIARGSGVETLSYFSTQNIAVGSIVHVPLRKKTVPALVVNAREASDAKAELKRSSFALKKIERVKSAKLLEEPFVAAAFEIADYYLGTPGTVLSALVPTTLFEYADKLATNIPAHKTQPSHKAEHLILQAPDEDRYAHYKSIIREEFAKGLSVFFCLPTIADIKYASESLKKGIESFTYVLHSGLTKKELLKIISAILEETHPVLIIATASFLAIPKANIGTIIVDRENGRGYKSQARPYIDLRHFAEVFADRKQAKLILGDQLLRAETIHRYHAGELVEVAPIKYRTLTTSTQEIVDMRGEKEDTGKEKKKPFSVFSPELEHIIDTAIAESGHVFLFTARRGLAPSTVCADCGEVAKCHSCRAHTVLHKGTENFFLCHRCGEKRTAREACTHCGSVRLTTLGIGAELVEEELKKHYPKARIFRIDSDKTPTHKKALDVIEKFYAAPGAILIGTEMALLYLSEKIEYSAVVSMDAFFSIPDFRINERILNILLSLRAATSRKLIVQTRDKKQPVFEYAIRGNIADFLRDELEDRKALGYPPFSTIIKIVIAAKTKSEAAKETEKLKTMIAPHTMDIFPVFIPQGKGKIGIAGIIKVPHGQWLSSPLHDSLRNLPLSYNIHVDPDSLV